DDGGQAGAACAAGNGHAVHARFDDSRKPRYRLGHLGRGHVLSLPTEGVADAVDEEEIAGVVLAHEVAGAKPGVARLEHVAQDLLLRLPRIAVALEAAGQARRPIRNLAERLSHLAGTATDAAAALVAHDLAALVVVAHQRGWRAMGEERRDAADGAGLALVVEQRDVAFGRGVELEDAQNPEP